MSRFRRGEVWLVDLGMTAKVRPCLVLSVPPTDQDRALVTLVPHTTSLRQSSFESVLRVPFLREGAFDAQGLVTVPQVKLLRRLGKLQPDQLESFLSARSLLFGNPRDVESGVAGLWCSVKSIGRRFWSDVMSKIHGT